MTEQCKEEALDELEDVIKYKRTKKCERCTFGYMLELATELKMQR
jgi:hypothetical protein